MSKGPAAAPVVLEFFADLHSPITRPALDVVDQVLRYPSSVRVQFRNFPLAFHPQAALAHERPWRPRARAASGSNEAGSA